MSARRTTARFALATAVVASLAFAGAAAPAIAVTETGGLWSATDRTAGNNLVQLSKTDAAATNLGAPVDDIYYTSVEVVDGVGYAIGADYDEELPFVATWDIATGAVLSSVVASGAGGATLVAEFYALDARADGTLLAYARLDVEGSVSMYLTSVDPVTGVVTPIVDLDSLDEDLYFEGIATNPVDGVTYLLADLDDGLPGTVAFDFDTLTIGELVQYPAVAASLGGGYYSEGDFDADGVLWFTYNDGVSRTSGPVDVAVDAVEVGTPAVESKAITVTGTGPYPEQLAATGLEVAPVAGGAALLLALGGALLIARRRALA
ncbi:hypothetical protein [Antiquaquibacter soli]|uniref:LPXTG cell wall anchor domain-containing protein n=1 Tax=Antiquaquibacter soli TaxID=3064523 RepID=A0ABT9BQD1_9MICO|nr:hypothetical protein [Protaetiibacter sp. WY-16]MDO7883228.1 hypothetical protein [Protaetiibacter sp. WY-16]